MLPSSINSFATPYFFALGHNFQKSIESQRCFLAHDDWSSRSGLILMSRFVSNNLLTLYEGVLKVQGDFWGPTDVPFDPFMYIQHKKNLGDRLYREDALNCSDS